MKIIDLSKTIQNTPKDPFFMRIKVKYNQHKRSLWLIRFYLKMPTRLLPKKFKGWSDEIIKRLATHSTTHMDAPWHYSPTCQGKPAKTIDEIPLEWCFGDGVVIDMKHKADFDPITSKDIIAFLEKENITLKPKMIVLINTGREKNYGTDDFYNKGTGMSAEATEWLIKQGIKVMGTDQWGWDVPLPHQIEVAKKTNNAELFWEAHLIGVDYEYCHMEQLSNLDALPSSGFKVAAFPLKLKGGSAAPTRVVAIFEE